MIGILWYIPSERSYICTCVFFRSGRAFVFPILFMIIYFSYFCCLYISVFYGSSYCLPKPPFCACRFIFELIWVDANFLLVQVTFMLCPCLPNCEHSSAHCPLKFRRLSSERRVTLDEQIDRNMIENFVDIVVIWTLKLSENCEMAL